MELTEFTLHWKAAGVRRIAIGIGNEIDKGELVQIAGNQQDVIQVNSVQRLNQKTGRYHETGM